MNKLYTLCLCYVCTVVNGAVLAAAPPAGIVIYASTNDEVYILLADHRHPSERGWAGFGGGANEDETLPATAARETEEETNGYFSRDMLRKGISGQEPVIDGSFHLYFLEVDFVPARRIENNRPSASEASYMERENYAWIPYSDIKQHLLAKSSKERMRLDRRYLPTEAKTDWLWDVWVQNMRVALESSMIPWERGASKGDNSEM